MIEDLNQNLNELNDKFNNRQNITDQLNNDILKLKQKLEQSEIRLQQYQVWILFFQYVLFIFCLISQLMMYR